MPILYVLIGILLGAILVPLLFILWIVVYALIKFTLLKTTGVRIVATVVRLEPNKYATKLKSGDPAMATTTPGKIPHRKFCTSFD